MTKTGIFSSIVLAASVLSGLAWAGNTALIQVSITGSEAQGTVAGARQSADTVQFIQCNTYSYASGSPAGSCTAKTAAGVTKQCVSTVPAQIAVMQSAGAASWIFFRVAADNYGCDQVSISNGSSRVQY